MEGIISGYRSSLIWKIYWWFYVQIDKRRIERLEVEKFDLKLGRFSLFTKSIYGRGNIHADDSSKRWVGCQAEYRSSEDFQESEKDECVIEVWNCIIDAVSYICRKIYEEQGADYFPEPIELVDEDTYSRLIDGNEKCMKQ